MCGGSRGHAAPAAVPVALFTPGSVAASGMTRADVTIHLKPGISDPEGANTVKALHLLGFEGVKGVHTTRIWTIELGDVPEAKAREQVDQMCRRLLTNPVIHDYSVEIKA
jgi:phosphoribosylformylglycinamidine synthase subunit PurS